MPDDELVDLESLDSSAGNGESTDGDRTDGHGSEGEGSAAAPTNDPAACKTFYAALLGWQYVDTSIDGHAYTVARLGEKPIAGLHAPRPDRAGKTPSHWLSYMSVADVDATVAKAKAAGGPCSASPTRWARSGAQRRPARPRGRSVRPRALRGGRSRRPADARGRARSSGTNT